MFFIFFAIVSILLIYHDKVWAKRTHIFLAALNIGYLIKTYILFTSCYNAYCPEKKFGLYLLILSSVVLMVVSVFPNTKVESNREERPLISLFKKFQFIFRSPFIQPYKIFQKFLIFGNLFHGIHFSFYIIYKKDFFEVIIFKIQIYNITGGTVHTNISTVFVLCIINTF